MPKYTTIPIDYTDCDPVIAEHLKRGEAIYCKCWDGTHFDDNFNMYVTSYHRGRFRPYNGVGGESIYATPIPPRIRVKKASEIVRWLEDNGYECDNYGWWVKLDCHSFKPTMFQYCGREKPASFFWLDEWLEEY